MHGHVESNGTRASKFHRYSTVVMTTVLK